MARYQGCGNSDTAERELVAESAYLMHRSLGRGHVIAFVEDPSFRAYLVGLNGLLFNALFFGPGY